MIDLRSDIVTKPSAGMLKAMMSAQVGNSVLGEDPTVAELEQKLAKMFNMEAGLFLPSATMSNQIAINLSTNPGQEVICEEHSHVYRHESGGMAFHSGASVAATQGEMGCLTAQQVEGLINFSTYNVPQSALVCLENTANHGGGAYYDFAQIEAISQLCRNKKLRLHLDGARIFNALVETSQSSSDYGPLFDTMTVCLSKGLGCPMGSVLLGSDGDIQQAKKLRNLFGGGMRQVGYMAAAGLYALEYNIERLSQDHQRAKVLEGALKGIGLEVLPVKTNIVIFKTPDDTHPQRWVDSLKEKGVLAGVFGKNEVRMVTHLDFDEADLERVVGVVEQLG